MLKTHSGSFHRPGEPHRTPKGVDGSLLSISAAREDREGLGGAVEKAGGWKAEGRLTGGRGQSGFACNG